MHIKRAIIPPVDVPAIKSNLSANISFPLHNYFSIFYNTPIK